MRLDEKTARRLSSGSFAVGLRETTEVVASLERTWTNKTRTSHRLQAIEELTGRVFGRRLVAGQRDGHAFAGMVLQPEFSVSDARHLLHADAIALVINVRSGRIKEARVARFTGHALARMLERKSITDPIDALNEEIDWLALALKLGQRRQSCEGGDEFRLTTNSGHFRFVVGDKKLAVAVTWIG